MNKFFKVLHRSTYLRQGFGGQRKSKARVGEIYTAHGVIKTPAFVPVATKGTVKTLLPSLLSEIKTQMAFVNTYHLVSHPGAEFIEKAGGIHQWAKLDMPLMSDSGGFQVFSLANKKARRRNLLTPVGPPGKPASQVAKNLAFSPSIKTSRSADVRGEEEPLVIKISDDGVKFRSTYDGHMIEFTPEKSIEYQIKIGADMMMAFDECTYYPATYEYSEKATERTHEWLKRCFIFAKTRRRNFLTPVGPPGKPASQVAKNLLSLSLQNKQYLYGIIQGATFEDLRRKSAKFVVSQNTDGVAIGGVSVGESKKEMRDQVRWVSDYLPSDRPVHLLGVGQFDDILDLVGYGIDTFDCVEPTRLARMGRLYRVQHHVFCSGGRAPELSSVRTSQGRKKQVFSPDSLEKDIDIFKSKYKYDLSSVDENCDCYVCKNFTKSYLHHLFKQREILGYNLATYHNLWVMERFFEKIRKLINENQV